MRKDRHRFRLAHRGRFLSIQAQDFIEDPEGIAHDAKSGTFLSIQAQDFIEDTANASANAAKTDIPEHSSSGLH